MVSIVTSVGADGSQPTKQFLHTTETDMVYRLDASDYKQYDSVHDLDDRINQWQAVYQGIQVGRF